MNRFYARPFYLLRSFHRGKKKSKARKLVSPKYILQFFEKEIRERILKLSSDNILPFRFRSNANESSNDDERVTYSTKSIKKMTSIIVGIREGGIRNDRSARRQVIIGFFGGHDLKEGISRPWVAIEEGCGWSRGFWNFGAAAFRVHRSRPVSRPSRR